MVIGFIWHHQKVFDNTWMEAAGLSPEELQGGNMLLIFGVRFLLSMMLAVEINFIAIHQAHLDSLFNGITDDGTLVYLAAFKETYGTLHRTFAHGMVHGVAATLFFVLPIMGTNAMFERKSFKYIAVNVGYWMLTLVLMSGVICQWG